MKNSILLQLTPNKSAIIHGAARVISEHGPMSREQLFAAMDFGAADARESKLNYAFETDWLREAPDGRIELTEYSQRQLRSQEPPEPYVGQVAPPAWRPNLMTGTLNPKYHTNSRGPRDDAPDWSRRETPNFRRA